MTQWIKTAATKPVTPEINAQDSLSEKRIFPKLSSDPSICTRTFVYICTYAHTHTFLKMCLFLCVWFGFLIHICVCTVFMPDTSGVQKRALYVP